MLIPNVEFINGIWRGKIQLNSWSNFFEDVKYIDLKQANANAQKEDTVENIVKNGMTYLTVESDDIDKIKKELNLKIVSQQNNWVKFVNDLSPNKLMDIISKYKINKLLIEEVTIEDLFMEYYK